MDVGQEILGKYQKYKWANEQIFKENKVNLAEESQEIRNWFVLEIYKYLNLVVNVM